MQKSERSKCARLTCWLFFFITLYEEPYCNSAVLIRRMLMGTPPEGKHAWKNNSVIGTLDIKMACIGLLCLGIECGIFYLFQWDLENSVKFSTLTAQLLSSLQWGKSWNSTLDSPQRRHVNKTFSYSGSGCTQRVKSVEYLRSIYHLFHLESIIGRQSQAPLLNAKVQTADQSHLMKTNALAGHREEIHFGLHS